MTVRFTLRRTFLCVGVPFYLSIRCGECIATMVTYVTEITRGASSA